MLNLIKKNQMQLRQYINITTYIFNRFMRYMSPVFFVLLAGSSLNCTAEVLDYSSQMQIKENDNAFTTYYSYVPTGPYCLAVDLRSSIDGDVYTNPAVLPGIKVSECNGSPEQKFIADQGKIINVASGLCLTKLDAGLTVYDFPAGTCKTGGTVRMNVYATNVGLKPCDQMSRQDWKIDVDYGARHYKVKNADSCLSLSGIYGEAYFSGGSLPSCQRNQYNFEISAGSCGNANSDLKFDADVILMKKNTPIIIPM